MIENLHFLHHKWLWPVLLGGAVLWLLFLWKENPKKPNIRFFGNGLVALLAITSLAMMVLKPMTLGKVETNAGVLITNAYSKDRLDSLRQNYSGLRVIPYQMNKGIGGALDSVAPLFVLGDGIRPFDFWQFDSVPALYLGSDTPKGIVVLKYNREITIGEELLVSGRFNAPANGHHLVLTALGDTGLDSVAFDSVVSDPVVMRTSQQTDFSLSTEMKVEGSYIYSLIEKDSTGNTILSESLPVTVSPKTSLKILLVNSFPTFESKYLKNYLAEMSHELTVRSRLTKGKYKFEYFNTGNTPVYTFSRKQLEDFDVLIIDSDSYVNLSEKSKNALIEAMEKDGLGVFIQPNHRFFYAPKRTLKFDFVNDESTETSLQKWPKLKADKYPFHFKPALGLEKIHGDEEKIHDDNKAILTAYRRTEKGRVGTSTIQNTYKWILGGHSTAYQEFWSGIIGQLSKSEEVSTTWSEKNELAFRDMPYTFDLRTTFDRPEIVGPHGNEIPIEQHPDIPELWTGTVYPQKAGWNELWIRNDSTSTHRFFVMDSSSYQALTRYQIQLANKRVFDGASSITQKRSVPKQISSIWFFFVFLTAMGWLWLGPKILGSS